MKTEGAQLSSEFSRLYGAATVFDSFSALHPVSFKRVLPFQPQDKVADNRDLLAAEQAHLSDPGERSRLVVVDAYFRCGLLPEADAANLKATIAFYDSDFFELMGLVYANAGMFKCALRWYCELIHELETVRPHSRSDEENVYASVGYCLYSLGLFPETILWSKACLGPRPLADAICQELILYETEPAGGALYAVERGGSNHVRYTISTAGPVDNSESISRLKTAMKAIAPFQEFLIDSIDQKSAGPKPTSDGNPFKAEFGGGSLPRHKMNLIFATCAQADTLIEKGYRAEAKRLLFEAALLEPEADIVRERLGALR